MLCFTVIVYEFMCTQWALSLLLSFHWAALRPHFHWYPQGKIWDRNVLGDAKAHNRQATLNRVHVYPGPSDKMKNPYPILMVIYFRSFFSVLATPKLVEWKPRLTHCNSHWRRRRGCAFFSPEGFSVCSCLAASRQQGSTWNAWRANKLPIHLNSSKYK